MTEEKQKGKCRKTLILAKWVVICCILTFFGLVSSCAEGPSSAPKPYPGAEIQVKEDAGSGWSHSWQTYTVTVALDNAEQYYEEQMSQYCKSGEWPFVTGPDSCLHAACDIRRSGPDQYFYVTLCSVSETQTWVKQQSSWSTRLDDKCTFETCSYFPYY